MRKKIAKRKKELTMPVKNITGILTANAVAIICISLFSLLCSLLLMKSQVLPNSLALYFIAGIALGSLINGFIAAKRCTAKGIISGLISGVPLAFIITIFMLIFTKGQIDTKALIAHGTVLICSTFGGIFGANTKRRR